VKWKEGIKHLFHLALKQYKAKKGLFPFTLKQNEKIGSEMKRNKKFWKKNKAKIRCTNFASVGSEKFWAKKKFSRERAKRMQNGSCFALFRFEAKKQTLFVSEIF
jgi:hypothetical protein